MKEMDKRGFWMGEESGKFILGVLSVVLLLFLAFKLAGIMTQRTQYEQAKYTMGELEKIIDSIKEGETKTLFIESPKEWWILAWPYQDKKEKPTNCGEFCICLCPIPATPTKQNSLESCFQKGVCKTTDRKALTFDYSKKESSAIKNTLTVLFGAGGRILYYGIEDYVNKNTNLPIQISGPIQIEMKKGVDEINITLIQ